MNVFDFDKTIYDGDSTIDFYFYCIRKHPVLVFCLPYQVWCLIKYKIKIIDKTKFKEEFYCFLKKIDDVDSDIKKFWDLNQHKIKKWYLKIQQPDDLVISASPEFLLQEICKRIGICKLIASIVNEKTGKYTGINCYGEEKINRFKECFFDARIQNFYSDSKSDQPMANLAENAFIVNGDEIKEWKNEK
ncbi:MAG: haloacid dehalogenase-like hydrolase [Lachnospiraceae bacterium]